MAESVITVLPLYHKNVAVKVKMNVEDNLDSDNFYDFWQLGGFAVVLCHNVRHIVCVKQAVSELMLNANRVI